MYIQIITPFQIQVINIHWRKGNSDNENSMGKVFSINSCATEHHCTKDRAIEQKRWSSRPLKLIGLYEYLVLGVHIFTAK